MTCVHRGRKLYESLVAGEVHQCTKFKENCVQLDSQYEAIKPGLIATHHSCESCQFFSDKRPILTIGMAYYRDWPGLWATIQSLFLHHQAAMEFVEIVVVDNDPNGSPNEASESNHSFKARQLCEKVGARYEHFTKVAGTAAAKGRIFDVATGDWVLVVDCHVMLPTLVLELFLGWIRQQTSTCKDLIQGPLIGDGGLDDIIGTEMRPGWGSLMYGQWYTDQRVKDSLEPFEIQMHGCGLFACRRDQWPGFHPQLRGFGPEEWHIHQRVRRNGGKILCLPWLKWCHRFGNPDGAKPPGLAPEDRLRGHLITHLDTGNGNAEWFSGCKRHFLESGMDEKTFGKVWVTTRREFKADWQPVGDHLHAILDECGIKRSTCPVCQQWREWMNAWGIMGCQQNRERIIERLNEQAKGASWFETIKVAGSGYLSTEAILDEAIRRAGSTLSA